MQAPDTVAGSPVLPAKTRTASGSPSLSVSNPMTN
mgnify:CR=1 FL=1